VLLGAQAVERLGVVEKRRRGVDAVGEVLVRVDDENDAARAQQTANLRDYGARVVRVLRAGGRSGQARREGELAKKSGEGEER
jgi:hypothetical protein